MAPLEKVLRAWSDPLVQFGHPCLFHQYPNLARIAFRVLQMHVTSCSVERVWSVMRHTIRDNRSCLDVQKIRKFLTIKAAASIRDNDKLNGEDWEDACDLFLSTALPQFCDLSHETNNQAVGAEIDFDQIDQGTLDQISKNGFDVSILS